MVDTDNIVWVATTEGFVRFDANFKNIGDINFYHYQNNHQISHGMGANDIYSIYEDNDVTYGLQLLAAVLVASKTEI